MSVSAFYSLLFVRMHPSTQTHTHTHALYFSLSLFLSVFFSVYLSQSLLLPYYFLPRMYFRVRVKNPNERIHKPSCDAPAVLFPVVSCCILLHSTYTLHILVIAYVRMHRKYMQDSPVRSLHRERFAAWVRTQQFPRRDNL